MAGCCCPWPGTGGGGAEIGLITALCWLGILLRVGADMDWWW